MVVGRTSTALGAYYRRIAYRIGKPKAITATARKLAILVYRTLKGELDYADPGASAYEEQHRERTLRNVRNLAFPAKSGHWIKQPFLRSAQTRLG
jgi:hypothetical protein